jgi:hypothetical protein
MQRFLLVVAAIATMVACENTFDPNRVGAPPGSNAAPRAAPDSVSDIGQSDSVTSGSTSNTASGSRVMLRR